MAEDEPTLEEELMADVTAERIEQAVREIKDLFETFEWSDIAALAEKVSVFADLFVLTGPEKKALAMQVAERVLAETDIPWLPDSLTLPFVGDVGADALILKFLPGILGSLCGASKGKLALNK